MTGGASLGEQIADEQKLSLLWSLSPRQIRRLGALLAKGKITWSSLERGAVPGQARIGDALCRSVAEEVRSWRESSPSQRLEMWRGAGIGLSVRSEPRFPERLGQIPDPPNHLFYRGPYWKSRQLLTRPRVGIIGSRAASSAGREIARRFARDLALLECVVVSGLARGIDSAAHQGALDAGGVSIAVLGTGPDFAYPSENTDIFEQMITSGGVCSEFPPGTSPLPYHFPRRNRLLAGWVDLLLVVEGGERSGARSTVDHALDQGREVAAVPRDVLLEGSALPNRLLFDGARLVRSAEDVLSLLEAHPPRTKKDVVPWEGSEDPFDRQDVLCEEASTASALTRSILQQLAGGTRTLEELCSEIESTPWTHLQTALTELEIRGVIERLPGDRLRRRRKA